MAFENGKPAKRTTNPGVRVVGGRIYDSSNGKTCHQCRQKTMDFVASCKVMKNNKPCTIMYCHKCLLNRYGEKAEEVANLADWECPKCRGNCNCSFCRKKRGQNPTGILAHKAKAIGLSSVSELLEVNGADSFAYERKAKPDNDVCNEGSGSSSGGGDTDVEVAGNNDVAKDNKNAVVKIKKLKAAKKPKEEIQFEAELPQGFSLSSVLGIDIPSEEAGNVLQLLSFCSTFEKALDLKEGEAETLVRELFTSGRLTRRQQYCSVIPMMIQLLDIIAKDSDVVLSLRANDSRWFTAVGEFVTQSEVVSEEFTPEIFQAGVSEYEKMDASKRLKLLNFLCDEALCTWTMRSCMDSQKEESNAKIKEAKQKAAAAKEKEKQLKQKMQSDLAKALLEKNGAPLTIEEHDSIMSRVKAEAKEAHEEILAAKGITSTKRQRCDALRTEPITVDESGLLLWQLKCYEEEPNFLLQDVGTFGDIRPHEKWSVFKPEQKEEIEKYISYKRIKLMRTQKKANVEKNANVAASEPASSPNSMLGVSEEP